MPVDFNNKAHIHVVHGVQTGDNNDIDSEKQIRELLTQALADMHVVKEFEVRGYVYEDINDKAQEFYQLIGTAITSGKFIAGKALKTVIDLVGDVVIAAENTSTAHLIRQGLRHAILDSYNAGHPCVVVAHSLGTVYSLDVVNELMGEASYFHGDDLTSWPVQGLITMGSPLGLDIDLLGINIFEQRTLHDLSGAEYSLFPWQNYYNRTDPVVSGRIFGAPANTDGAKGPLELRYGPSIQGMNWLLQGHVVTSGRQWLMAHTAYWNNPAVADRIFNMLWG